MSHWLHAIITFLFGILGGSAALTFVRCHPESLHKFLATLADWIRFGFIFVTCIAFVLLAFRLTSPKLRHLACCHKYPPTWLALILAGIVVAILDVSGALSPEGYRASVFEWFVYGCGSLLVVSLYSGLPRYRRNLLRRQPKPGPNLVTQQTLADIENAPWEEFEKWLASDAPASYDFLGGQLVAERVSNLILSGTRSIGIVGRFGAGKTSIVEWIKRRLQNTAQRGQRCFICHHSCWGFKTSASAIDDMLRSAVQQLGNVIDTFRVGSLPEAYRQTFSGGDTWVNALSTLMWPRADAEVQFAALSEILGGLDARIVFVVEDLDRSQTRQFEIQEVLAFLERWQHPI